MKFAKWFSKRQSKIIEGLVVCFVGAWFLTSIIRDVPSHILDKSYAADNFLLTIIILVMCFAAFVALYVANDKIARLAMLFFTYLFLLINAYNGYGADWLGSSAYNAIGGVCFALVLYLVAILAFIYVRKDVFYYLSKLKINKKTATIVIIVIAVALFAVVSVATILRYTTYSNSTYDFGIFTQMYEYMSKKGVMSTTLERSSLLSHLAVHFSPIFYLGLPFYFIASSPITVALIQALMIALPVIPIALLCRKFGLSRLITIALVLLYALYPATAGGSMYDIHENCFLTFFILMAVWAMERKKNLWIVIFTVCVFLVKEDAAIYIMALGAYFFFSKRDKKRGIILVLASAIYFVIATLLIEKYGAGLLDSNLSNLYFDNTRGVLQIIQTVIANPSYALSQMVANFSDGAFDKIGYLITMIAPVAVAVFTTRKKYSRYLLLIPFIVLNVMTTQPYMHNIGFQYNFGTIALMWYLMIMNISDMNPQKARTTACVCVLGAGIFFTALILPRCAYYADKYSSNKDTYEQMDEALNLIPDDASVCASGYLIPHLSKHLEMYDQSYLSEDFYADYLAVDMRYGTQSDEAADFSNILSSGEYELIYNAEDVIAIYQKKQ